MPDNNLMLRNVFTNAVCAPLTSNASATCGWIRVTGEDRVRWLNGMATNSVQALQPGHGAYTFFLNAQGRIQGDANVWAAADSLFLQTSSAQVGPLMTLLDKFIIMDDVELADESGDWFGVQVLGATAAALLTGLSLSLPAEENECLVQQYADAALKVIRQPTVHVARFELWSQSRQAIARLQTAFLAANVTVLNDEFLNTLRILEGTPLFGTDIRDRDLPQETAQTRALHFNKGCYLGQEIVERIHSRGNVHRSFHAFLLTGEAPPAGSVLDAEGKAVGELTSIATLPNGTIIALGYIRREALEKCLPLTFAAGTAQPVASPIPLRAIGL